MSIETVKIIRGDTFRADAVYRDTDGIPVDLDAAGITVTAVARDPDATTTVELDVVQAPDQAATPGEFSVTGDTAAWVTTADSRLAGWRVRFSYTSAEGRFSSDVLIVDLVE